MSQIRRSPDRRRRVLYQSHVSPHTPSTPATRRAAEEMRAARQPANDFGSRVHRQLRGRWFSLVPVSRFAITVVASVFLVIPVALTILHHLAYTWPSLAYHEGIARPLYIDRSDSFAAWWTTMVLVVSAGATRLIYVLRRHRRDDYRGHYQLWQLTLWVLLLASVHSIVGLVDWVGALLELVVGDRAVLSGANWFRIVLDVGGIILAMRLVPEVYRCRPALFAMILACAFLGGAEAAAWQLYSVDTLLTASLVTAAPMLGWSSFLVAATIYLRSMYRQIRNIPDAPSIRQRLADWREQRRIEDDDYESDFFQPKSTPKPALAKVTTNRAATESTRRPPERNEQTRVETTQTRQKSNTRNEVAAEDDDSSLETNQRKRGLFSRLRRRDKDDDSENERSKAKGSESGSVDSSDAEDASEAKAKRRWFGLRAAKQVVEKDDEGPSDQDEAPKRKKRGFSLRLKPQRDEAQTGETEADPIEDDAASTGEKKGWFGGLLGRKKASADADSESDAEQPASEKRSASGPLSARATGPLGSASRQQKPQANRGQQSHRSDDDEEMIDPDDLDWNSMSKAERRRMRKKLKRSGRAA